MGLSSLLKERSPVVLVKNDQIPTVMGLHFGSLPSEWACHPI